MASSKEYLEFVLDQLSGLDEITYKAMMGEFILYYRGRIIGGIYDDRFLVKPIKAAAALMPDAPKELPYEGAKEMLLVEDVDNRDFLTELIDSMYDELPAPKAKKKKEHIHIRVDGEKMTVLTVKVAKNDQDDPVSVEVGTDVFGQMDRFAFKEEYEIRISDDEIYKAVFSM